MHSGKVYSKINAKLIFVALMFNYCSVKLEHNDDKYYFIYQTK